MNLSNTGEDQKMTKCRGNKKFLDYIFFFEVHASNAFSASSLRAVVINGLPLDITASGIDDHSIFVSNEIFNVYIAFIRLSDFCPSLIAVLTFNFYQLFFDNTELDLFMGKDL